MLSNKNSPSDLESKRPIFFLLGISITLLGLIFVFQYKTEREIIFQKDHKFEEVETVSIFPPITFQNPSPPVAKNRVNPDIFLEVEFLPFEMDPEPSVKLEIEGLGEMDQDLIEIPVELIDEIELVDIYGADKIAVPFECANLLDKGERIVCLSHWMAMKIKKEIKYPRIEVRNRNEGTVYISFEVSEKGNFSNIKVLRGVSPLIDEEAKRVISQMPQITPAINNGRPAKMSMIIPVSFKLK